MLDDNSLLWIDGHLVRAAEATVAATDHGLTVGDGAFETLQIIDRTPFAITRHIHRLRVTLAALAIAAPDDGTLRAAMAEVIAANEVSFGRLRLTVTGGNGPLGSGAAFGKARVIAAAEPMGDRPVPVAVTVPWTRNERGALVGLKTTSYAENVRALRYAHEQGAGEALFANTLGQLCEGTGTNVFVVVGDKVLTPGLEAGPLAGVTRALVLEHTIAEEADLPLGIVHEADAVLLTSSTRDVQPLERVDHHELDQGGAVAQRVVATFDELLRSNLDP